MYRWSSDFHRMGTIESLFLATDEEITMLRGAGEISFYEVLGKHSEIYIDFKDEEIREITDDSKVVSVMADFLPIGVDLIGRARDKIAEG